jgi:colanic acid biosynthesis glycosyl transferase WcaI
VAFVFPEHELMVLKRLGIPIICSVQDIFPEVLSGKDMIKPNGRLFRIIRNYNSRHLHRCDMVISLSKSMVDLLIKDRGLSPKKVHFIPNWMDASKFPPGLPRDGVFRKKLGINSEVLLAVFAGSLTMAAGPDLYVQAAGKLSGRTDIRILLVGDGSMREKLQKDIASRGLDNIQVVYPLKSEELPEVQAAADVLLLSLKGRMLQSLVPSKQIAYMFSGRPVMASLSKENTAAKILLEAEAGFVLSPDDPQAVADLMARLAQDRSSLHRLGDNARRFAEENFSKLIVLPRLVSLLESVVNQGAVKQHN